MVADFVVQVIVLGESGVGKTSLLLRYAMNAFKPQRPSTIIDCIHKVVKINDKEVKFQLWDTAGQDKFNSIVKQYYRIAHGVLLVYDVTDITTFHKLSKWLEDLRALNKQATVIIVGNKTDSQASKTVSINAVRNFAEQEGLQFFEVSAKKGENVDKIFEYLAMNVTAAGRKTEPFSSVTNSSVASNNIKPLTTVPSTVTDFQISSKNTETLVNKAEEISKEPESLPVLSTTDSIKENPTVGTKCRKRIINAPMDSYSSDALPPIIPLPQDTIDLRVQRKGKSNSSCC